MTARKPAPIDRAAAQAAELDAEQDRIVAAAPEMSVELAADLRRILGADFYTRAAQAATPQNAQTRRAATRRAG